MPPLTVTPALAVPSLLREPVAFAAASKPSTLSVRFDEPVPEIDPFAPEKGFTNPSPFARGKVPEACGPISATFAPTEPCMLKPSFLPSTDDCALKVAFGVQFDRPYIALKTDACEYFDAERIDRFVVCCPDRSDNAWMST